MVTIHYYLGLEWEVPVIIVLLLCFIAGILFGCLSCFIKRIGKKS
ncbi:LapA family protein [Nitrosomonas sp.]